MVNPITKINATLWKVSPPIEYNYKTHHGTIDLYKLGFKTTDGKRILVTLNTKQLGWSRNLNLSKIYYLNTKSNRLIKMTWAAPKRYIGKKCVIKGFLECLNKEDKKYRLLDIKEIILCLED